jgi:hypothetical protein
VRREIRWGVTAIAALGVGVMLAQPYARVAAPGYAALARLIAADRPWEVKTVAVAPSPSQLGAELRLDGYVRRHREDPRPAARVVGRVQVGEAIETPLLFWALLLAWPATHLRQRIVRLGIGVPVWLGLEAITTTCQLLLPMAQASAILASGDRDAVTSWDHWSRFLEAGGQFVIVCGAAAVIGGSTMRTVGARSPLRLHWRRRLRICLPIDNNRDGN